MSERLPGPARTINTVETSRHLIEKNLRLLATTIQDAFQVDLVGGVFRQFFRAANCHLNEFTDAAVHLRIDFVKCPLSVPARIHHARLLEQSEMRRNARLSHV